MQRQEKIIQEPRKEAEDETRVGSSGSYEFVPPDADQEMGGTQDETTEYDKIEQEIEAEQERAAERERKQGRRNDAIQTRTHREYGK